MSHASIPEPLCRSARPSIGAEETAEPIAVLDSAPETA